MFNRFSNEVGTYDGPVFEAFLKNTSPKANNIKDLIANALTLASKLRHADMLDKERLYTLVQSYFVGVVWKNPELRGRNGVVSSRQIFDDVLEDMQRDGKFPQLRPKQNTYRAQYFNMLGELRFAEYIKSLGGNEKEIQPHDMIDTFLEKVDEEKHIYCHTVVELAFDELDKMGALHPVVLFGITNDSTICKINLFKGVHYGDQPDTYTAYIMDAFTNTHINIALGYGDDMRALLHLMNVCFATEPTIPLISFHQSEEGK